MNNYSAFIRSHHAKSSMNNENDENSSIKNLFLKHLSKSQQTTTTTTTAVNGKGTIRGILGELGNTAVSKTKLVQQSVATIIETKSSSQLSAFVAAAPIPQVINKIEEIVLNDPKTNEVPEEFDCDSGDTHNIITAAEYVVDICKYWRNLEEQTPIRPNFLLNRMEGRFSF